MFFTHMFFMSLYSVKSLRTEMSLNDEETEQILLDYFPKILFQAIMMIIFPMTFILQLN